MRWILAVALSLFAGVASAQTVVTTTVTVTTAQQDAETMARTGVLRHCGRSGGRREGIGLGATREQAIRNCCFYGQLRPVEIGVARGRSGRWFACIRYE